MRTLQGLPIAEVANRTGLSVDTLRYYEKAGLADPPARDSAGRRVYSEEDVGWLLFVTRLRSAGMPIRLLQEYAILRHQGDESLSRRLQILIEHREMVRERRRSLDEWLEILDYKIANYAEVERALAATLTPAPEPAAAAS